MKHCLEHRLEQHRINNNDNYDINETSSAQASKRLARHTMLHAMPACDGLANGAICYTAPSVLCAAGNRQKDTIHTETAYYITVN